MALRRVRSKKSPKFESIVSDDWIAAFPDDWDVLDDDLDSAKVSAIARQTATETNQAGSPAYEDDNGYR